MSYADYYPQEHHSPHVASKNHFDPYPQQPHQQHTLSPHPHHPASHSHHSSPLIPQHASPHLGHHMPPRSYPTLEMSSYPDGEGGHIDRSHPGAALGSPMLDGPPSRGPTPVGGYYAAVAPHERAMHRNGSVEPSYAHSAPHLHHSSPHLRTPDHSHRAIHGAAPYGPTLKIVQWTPQAGEEGSQVTIILDALAITGAPPTQYSIPAFGPGSPSLNKLHTKTAVTRRFVVVFGGAPAPTKFTRAQAIDGNGVGESMDAGPDERDAFVVLTCFVPARQSMGPLDERVMVIVRVVDEQSEVLEEAVVGEWDALPMPPATPPRYGAMKRAGEELLSERYPPALRSPHSPRKGRSDYLSPAGVNLLVSPRQGGGRSEAPEEEYGHPAPIHHQQPEEMYPAPQPELIRSSQIPSAPSQQSATYSNKAVLKLQGDLNTMAMGWSNEEWTNRRRLIQFWRQQEGNVINATFRPISQAEFVPNSIVISCIFRDEWNECFVTSVDTIYLLEALVGVRFTVEEKNRIRRNLEGFKPQTVSKAKPDSEPFFKLIMGFPNPKPRNIEKDVKVFPWKILANALKKIISKYSATYPGPAPPDASPHVNSHSDDGMSANGGNSRHLEPLAPITFAHPHSPHLVSPHIGHSMTSPHVGGGGHFEAGPSGSPGMGGQHPLPPLPPVHQSPNPNVHSHPPSPHVPQSPSMHQNHSQQSDQEPPTSHTRPGSFDFNNLLDSSTFANGASNGAAPHGATDAEQEADESLSITTSRRPATRSSNRNKGSKLKGEAEVPQDPSSPAKAADTTATDKQAPEDNAPEVDADAQAMPPPPLHSRSYSNSEGPAGAPPRRPSTSGGAPGGTFTSSSASPFGNWAPSITLSSASGSSGQEYYAQDLAGVSGWGIPAPLPFSDGSPMLGGPMLRRSSSLEGLREMGESGALGWER